MTGIYIHIPFCRRICPYCDFYRKRGEVSDEFLKALLREIGFCEHDIVDTIYLGGGTPSLLKPKQLELVFNEIHKVFRVSKDAEITIEANPEDVDLENLRIWRSLGIDRLSIGVQTFNERGLKVLGRWQSVKECFDSVYNSLNSGFNTNIDIIFAYPEQTLKEFEEDLKTAIRAKPHHISAYSLQIEEKTLYGYWASKGFLKVPENIRDFYVLRDDILRSNEYIRYEVSNFSRRGYECKHNLKYWKREKYLGFGPSAASFFPESKTRVKNIPSMSRYIREFPTPREYEILTPFQESLERIYLGLRIGSLSIEDLKKICGEKVVDGVLEFLDVGEFVEVKSEYLHIFDAIVERLIATL